MVFRQAWDKLVRFKKERDGFDPTVKKPARKPPVRMWTLFRPNEEDVDRLKALVSSARRLEALTQLEGWSDIIEAKMYYQSLYDYMTKDPNQNEQARFRAACEWSAIEGFFKEISMRIRRGREAENQLEKIVKK